MLVPSVKYNPLLIIGSNGQLSRDPVLARQRLKIDRYPAQRNCGSGGIVVDMASEPDFNPLLRELQPAWVLKAAAYSMLPSFG